MYFNSPSCFEFLLVHAPQLAHEKDKFNNTPLIWAVRYGTIKMVCDILKHGPDVYIKDDYELTAIDYANRDLKLYKLFQNYLNCENK